MAPRVQKMRSLTEIMNDGRSHGPSNQQAEYALPMEVLELILSKLNLRENILASAVCKRWQAAAVSVRRANRPPWIMYFPGLEDVYEFYDSSSRKTYYLELPELHDARVRYAKDGWLLCSRSPSLDVFLFCPYTREMVALPNLQVALLKVAFSAPPTSPDCVLFAVERVTFSVIAIRTCRPGDTQWHTFHFYSAFQQSSSTWNQIVFCNDHFYCLSLSGELGFFSVKNTAWAVYVIPPPKCMENLHAGWRWLAKFVAEHNETIYVVCTCAAANPFIYKLDGMNGVWVEMDSLGGMSFFANDVSSHFRTDLVGQMANNVVFSKVLYYGKRCVVYSPTHSRYFPKHQFFNWGEDLLDRIWIEAPEDTSCFL